MVTERTERPCNALLALTSRYISSGICIVAFMPQIISNLPDYRNAVLLYFRFSEFSQESCPQLTRRVPTRCRRRRVRRTAIFGTHETDDLAPVALAHFRKYQIIHYFSSPKPIAISVPTLKNREKGRGTREPRPFAIQNFIRWELTPI